ncbi:hypothetical protein VP01_10507g1, partial [Puccinia sorghi]
TQESPIIKNSRQCRGHLAARRRSFLFCLRPFNYVTKIMEGDGPTRAFSSRKRSNTHPMYAKMIEKLETYQEEALECVILVMATLLHPTFQLKLFTH